VDVDWEEYAQKRDQEKHLEAILQSLLTHKGLNYLQRERTEDGRIYECASFSTILAQLGKTQDTQPEQTEEQVNINENNGKCRLSSLRSKWERKENKESSPYPASISNSIPTQKESQTCTSTHSSGTITWKHSYPTQLRYNKSEMQMHKLKIYTHSKNYSSKYSI